MGPDDGETFRLWEPEPGRLAIDDPPAGRPGAGWAEPAGLTGTTALVRLSTAAVPSADAVAGVLASVIRQARAAGAERVVVDGDGDDRVAGDGVVAVPPLRLSNSLQRRVQRFVSLRPGAAGMYSCGPTVYSYAHLGNMRAYVFADTVKRALLWRGYRVHHIINITDVGHLIADTDEGEDKVEAASRREGRSVEEITGHYSAAYWDDLRALNVLWPDAWPKASEYVPQMINFAAVLHDRTYGYVLPQGLYFDTSRQPGYGALAGIDTGALRSTGRVEDVAGRRNPSDFALWRTFTDGRPRLMQWESPWGVGAPGWHLECSVMSMALLGDHFDIHTGGVDHRELHHVNEIAQSEAYLEDGRDWVPYWLHNEFLNFKGSKMAKSEGGILRLADLRALGVHPLAFRYLLLGSHFASQMAFSESLAEAAHLALKRLNLRLAGALGPAAGGGGIEEPVTLAEAIDTAAALGSAALQERLLVVDALAADDLQTPKLLAQVQDWSKAPDELPAAEWEVLVRAVNAVTGLRLGALGPAAFVPELPPDVDVGWVEDRLRERDAARAAKEWDMADRMRDELSGRGIRVEDTPEGPHWYWVGRPG